VDDHYPVVEASGVTSTDATRMYLAMLSHPLAGRDQLTAMLAIDARGLDEGLTELARQGSVILHADGTWQVPPPDIVLPARAGQLEREALRIRGVAEELAVIYRRARSTQDGEQPIEMLDNREDVLRSFIQLLGGARVQVRGLDRPPYASAEHAVPDVQRQQAAEGVRFSSVYDIGVIEGPSPMTALNSLNAVGEQVRLLRGVPLKMVVSDDDAALVIVRTDEDRWRGSMLVRRSPLLDSLILLFETLWRLAVPLPRASDELAQVLESRDQPVPRDLQVLTLLAGGATDESIARQLGMSTRTVERRVRAMLDRLGAETRFQAGVQAARRGWL
jgi:DNA-binding CsgD family transcriptional regulator